MESSKRSLIIGYGDEALFTKLATAINQESKTNETYTKAKNSIEISKTDRVYSIKINTKYYDEQSELVVVSMDEPESELSSKLKLIVGDCIVEGVLILVDSKNRSILNSTKLNCLRNVLHSSDVDVNEDDDEDESLKLVVFDGDNHQDNDDVKIDSYLSINVNLNTTDMEAESNESLGELIDCLLAHSWKNMKLKEQDQVRTKENAQLPSQPAPSEQQAAASKDEKPDEAAFDFEHLISNLNEMRSKANEMSFDERKKYAEKVVLNFWKSIGGDVDEIGDLDADDN